MMDRFPWARSAWRDAAVVVVLLASASPVSASCPEFRRLAEAALPSQVGNRLALAKLLNPPVHPQLPDFLAEPANMRRTLIGLRTVGLKPDRKSCGLSKGSRRSASASTECLLRSARTGDSGRIRVAEGEIAVAGSPPVHVALHGIVSLTSDAAVINTARAAARSWGVPVEEIQRSDQGLIVQRHTTVSAQPSAHAVQARDSPVRSVAPLVELQPGQVRVLAGRQVAGVPVLGSGLEAVLDGEGRIVRTNIRWPRFCIDPQLVTRLDEKLAARQQVIQKVVDSLTEKNACGSLSRLGASILYVRSASGRCYVPALALHPVQKDGVNAALEGEPQYLIPLLREDPPNGQENIAQPRKEEPMLASGTTQQQPIK
ncbi:MAG TPA: hypothetical protein VEC57_02465 [Candidatus Limnocylindrales bacterium]|nr:hypothetical protein [Candidatus Limnocylindrales bacterium]